MGAGLEAKEGGEVCVGGGAALMATKAKQDTKSDLRARTGWEKKNWPEDSQLHLQGSITVRVSTATPLLTTRCKRVVRTHCAFEQKAEPMKLSFKYFCRVKNRSPKYSLPQKLFNYGSMSLLIG